MKLMWILISCLLVASNVEPRTGTDWWKEHLFTSVSCWAGGDHPQLAATAGPPCSVLCLSLCLPDSGLITDSAGLWGLQPELSCICCHPQNPFCPLSAEALRATEPSNSQPAPLTWQCLLRQNCTWCLSAGKSTAQEKCVRLLASQTPNYLSLLFLFLIFF